MLSTLYRRSSSLFAAVKKTLVLCPANFDESIFITLHKHPEVKQKYSLVNAKWDTREKFNLYDYTERCIGMVRDCNIDAVISGSDVGSVVHAALSDTFPHIRGPSVEAAFLTSHKYYGARILDPDIPQAKSILLNLDDSLEVTISKASDFLKNVGGVCCVKPVIGESSFGVHKITGTNELHKALTHLQRNNDCQFISKAFAHKWIDVNTYPYALSPCILLEEYIDALAITTANCCVRNGQIMHMGVHDWLFDRHPPREGARTFLGGFAPSCASSKEEAKVWQLADKILRKLIEKGFDNQFLNIEFFSLPNGEYKFLEVNGRVDLGMAIISQQVYTNGDLVQDLLQLSCGETIETPSPNGLHGMWGFVDTYASGKAERILDFDEISKIPEVTTQISPGEHIALTSEMYGTNVATTYIVGNTREEIIRKHYDICRRILKKPEFSPWGEVLTTD